MPAGCAFAASPQRTSATAAASPHSFIIVAVMPCLVLLRAPLAYRGSTPAGFGAPFMEVSAAWRKPSVRPPGIGGHCGEGAASRTATGRPGAFARAAPEV